MSCSVCKNTIYNYYIDTQKATQKLSMTSILTWIVSDYWQSISSKIVWIITVQYHLFQEYSYCVQLF